MELRPALVALALVACSATPDLRLARLSHWPGRPDPALTPGAVLPVTAAQVCTKGYATKVRSVPPSRARAVFAAYHVPYSERGKGELDHLVSLELGGSNDATNLWPQFGKRPNPKDGLENRLHADVCAGRRTLAEAQAIIRDPSRWP